MLCTLKEVLGKANKEHYAVGAFNVNNLEIIKAVTLAAEKQKSPVIIQTSEGAIEYAGLRYLYNLAMAAVEESNVPIVLHLDHGKDVETIRKCIQIGYTSVMFDGSHLPFDENVKITRKIAYMAEKKDVSVEAELGTIGGVEDKVSSRNIILTDPDDAYEFVQRTNVDALAIAIGTSHGAYKFSQSAKLDIKRLAAIKKKVKLPLVLHGASGAPEYLLKLANKYGAHIVGAKGVPDLEIALAIKQGINKINTDTDLRLAFDAGVRKFLKTNPKEFDPRKILGPSIELMQKVSEHRMQLFGSCGKV